MIRKSSDSVPAGLQEARLPPLAATANRTRTAALRVPGIPGTIQPEYQATAE